MRRLLSPFAALALLTTTLTLVSAVVPARAATIVHVDQNAVGFANGTSWADAFTDLQTALGAATSGDEIRIAAGTYRPATSDRTVSFTPPDGVTIIGGYATGGGPASDPSAYRTTLSGDLIGDDLPGFLNTSDNSHHVVDLSGTTGITLLAMTIEGGNADGSAASTAGGGVRNDGASELRLDTIVVRKNSAASGGGLANLSSSPVIVNSRFQENSASEGGGIYNLDGDPTLIATRVMNNTASSGGGIYSGNADTTTISSIIAFNSSNVGGGIHNDGSTTSWINTVVAGNTGASGAGVYSVFANTTMTNSILWGNSGAAIEDAFGGSTNVTHSVVEGGWPGVGNLVSDPLFEGAADFRLQAQSPARDLADSGSLPVDEHDADADGDTLELAPAIDGRPRINGTTADIGAHETAVAFDAFTDAGLLTGATGTVNVSTVGATNEPGEPTAACAAGPASHSVWLSWTAATTAPMQFDTLGSSFDTVLQVHTGSAVDTLTTADCNNDVIAAATSDSAVVIDATAGTTYHLQVDGVGVATGLATVTWSPASTVTPTGVVATEGDAGTTTWQLPVTLSGPSTIPVVVDWDVLDLAPATGIATAGIDLVQGSGTLTIDAGQTEASLPVEVIGDVADEDPLLYGEWALVRLANPVNTRVTGGLFGTGIVIIIDDD